MPILSCEIAYAIVGNDPSEFAVGGALYINNETTNTVRDGLSWETCFKTISEWYGSSGRSLFIKATDTPYRDELNDDDMLDQWVFCNATGDGQKLGNKRAKIYGSNTFTWSIYDAGNHIYSAVVPDKTDCGEIIRNSQFMPDHFGFGLFTEILAETGSHGVWIKKSDDAINLNHIALTRVQSITDLIDGTWYFAPSEKWITANSDYTEDADILEYGTMYICTTENFDDDDIEVCQRPKACETWTDAIPDNRSSGGIIGAEFSFAVQGHSNGTCSGWKVVDSIFCWNAWDGFAIPVPVAEQIEYNLYSEAIRCICYKNGQDGFSNYADPYTAMGKNYSGFYGLNMIQCLSFANGRDGLHLHTANRVASSDPFWYSTITNPIQVIGCTIVDNGRYGIVLTDGAMADVIFWSFGQFDGHLPTEGEGAAWYNGLSDIYDSFYVKLRNNLVVGNGVADGVIKQHEDYTDFFVDSDYNNFGVTPTDWAEGEHSISEETVFTDPQQLQFNPINSACTGAGVDLGETYFPDYRVFDRHLVFDNFQTEPDYSTQTNIGAFSLGFFYAYTDSSWSMPTIQLSSSTPALYPEDINSKSLTVQISPEFAATQAYKEKHVITDYSILGSSETVIDWRILTEGSTESAWIIFLGQLLIDVAWKVQVPFITIHSTSGMLLAKRQKEIAQAWDVLHGRLIESGWDLNQWNRNSKEISYKILTRRLRQSQQAIFGEIDQSISWEIDVKALQTIVAVANDFIITATKEWS